ncbi:hypothetical protein DBR43_09825 [Pedobacter sp. KBW06]|uniref:MauE/DoxX family redox-associated membrane protein n=1 Tax=Pedobacter sp. KBW06 TaxID=2153359 RepID=UPI000F5A1FE3|nr:MauE/DoxX family redox-associated membrane protein [Pedobacter sp. KBW06]RQO75626.1 hypothetical protein DBR43_09825 [Pedobacter sp. KBW06]
MPERNLKKINKDRFVVLIIVMLYVFLFFYAAAFKLFDVDQFRMQIGQSPLLTDFSGILSWLIPVSEIVIGCCLIIPDLRLKALYAALTLMLMFIAYIITILGYSDYIPCACGGILERLSWKGHLIFNGVFAVLGIAGILLETRGVLVLDKT